MIRRPPRSTQSRSSAASDVYKRQVRATALGTIRLGRTDFTTSNLWFNGSTATMSGSTITIVLGAVLSTVTDPFAVVAFSATSVAVTVKASGPGGRPALAVSIALR